MGLGWEITPSKFHIFCIEVLLNGWARADQVAVAVSLIDTTHSGPDFASKVDPRGGVSSLLPRVAMVPLVCHQVVQSVGSILQNIVLSVNFTTFDLCDFCPDLLKGVNQPVEFELVLTLCRLDHQGAVNWPACGGSVEAVVHQTLCNVRLVDVCSLLEHTTVKNQLVSDTTLIAFKHDFIVILQTLCNVVGIQDGLLSRLQKSFGAE